MAIPIFVSGLLVLCFSIIAIASDPSPLQDFCVADANSTGIITFVHVYALCLNGLEILSWIITFTSIYFPHWQHIPNSPNRFLPPLPYSNVNQLP